ncbi:hypothetical protein LIZ91_06165 [Enterococcus avium]|uniref:hypothetical protein n=1 Tax=Enterococcus avium TaxID=33945 RepID=UPI001D079200|nr:hypothetical protein [Enterococcus avium]MCB6916168.1 hypothetical protein [Enterococcus avium]MCQ4960025.1 hypothetical protein [Enterococcus avium]
MKNDILKRISKKRSISGVESYLKSSGFTIIPPTGGDYKYWYNRSCLIIVKIIDLSPHDCIEDYLSDEYDVLIGRTNYGEKISCEISVLFE